MLVDRKLDPGMTRVPGRDLDWAELRDQHMNVQVPCVWLESNAPSYIL
jgi:propionyl-CoA synthetase